MRALLLRIVLVLPLCLWPRPPLGAAEQPEIAYAGLAVSTFDPASAGTEPDPQGAGLKVEGLDPQGPAARAGVHRDDLLLRLDDQRLFTPGQLRALLRTLSPGSSAALRLSRGGTVETLRLQLGTSPSPREVYDLRVAKVPFEVWNSPAGWGRLLEDVIAQEPESITNRVEFEASGPMLDWVTRGTGSLIQDLQWLVLLQAGPSATPPSAPSQTSLSTVPPYLPATPQGGFAVPDDQGSIEVRVRGGREYAVVRDAQGAVVYEGPLNSEQDFLLLRPLRTDLRQSVEASLGPDRAVLPPIDVELWRITIPPPML